MSERVSPPGRRWSLRLVGLACCALALISCREEEQGRPLVFDKGAYSGEPDDPVQPEQYRELRERTQLQSF